MGSHSTFLATLILSMQKYRQIESSDGNWSFAWISCTGSTQMSVLIAACRINQVCNGPYCRHHKKSKRRSESHVGSWSDQWRGVFLSQIPPLEIEGYSVSKAFLSGLKCFLELTAFKSEYQWCVGIRIWTRNKHVWNWNAGHDTCSHWGWKKYVSLVSEIVCLLLRHKDQTPGARTASSSSSSNIKQPKIELIRFCMSNCIIITLCKFRCFYFSVTVFQPLHINVFTYTLTVHILHNLGIVFRLH